MRVAFVAQKLTKTLWPVSVPGYRRVPCGARARRGEKNSLRSDTFSSDSARRSAPRHRHGTRTSTAKSKPKRFREITKFKACYRFWFQTNWKVRLV